MTYFDAEGLRFLQDQNVLSWFKSKSKRIEEASFKTRVELFWKWFEAESHRLYQVVDAGQSETLGEEISAQVESLGLVAWVFGPGAGGIGHSLTVTGEGNLHQQLLTIYWVSRAPRLDGWTFYPARQADVDRICNIHIEGHGFDPKEFWLIPKINIEDEVIDLDVWHPKYESFKAESRGFVLFLFLDEALGEYGTQQWIGKINYNPSRLGEAIPITELREYVERLKQQHDWRKLPPGESGSLYTLKEPHNRYRRGDIISLATTNPTLLIDYLDADGDLDDPLNGTGADYIYIAFDRSILPPGAEVEKRGQIEDALDQELRQPQSGRLIGGAMGTDNAYIDLMIYDQSNSIDHVRKVLADFKLPPGTSINYFAKEKIGWKILL